jgi:hypothetical protein
MYDAFRVNEILEWSFSTPVEHPSLKRPFHPSPTTQIFHELALVVIGKSHGCGAWDTDCGSCRSSAGYPGGYVTPEATLSDWLGWPVKEMRVVRMKLVAKHQQDYSR